MLTCPEPTFEGLTRLLREGALAIGVFSNEGGQFIGGYAMNNDNRLKTAAALSKLWEGEPIKRVRQSDSFCVLRGRRVCLHLLIQPGVATRLFGDPILKDQGVLTRMLASMPDTVAGTRFQHDPRPESFSNLSNFSSRLDEILRTRLPLGGGKNPELKPKILRLSEGAQQLWREFADHIERQIGRGGALEPVRGLANKAPEHAARLGAIRELVANPEASQVSCEAMAAGVVLVKYYLGEALRIRAASIAQPDLELAERLLQWLQSDWKEPNKIVSLPDIYQLGPYAIRDQRIAARIVAILESHGWLEHIDGTAEINGIRRRKVWRIVDQDGET
jgi:hypothetical protein